MKAPTSTYVPELTGIREIGAFGVLLTHAAFWTGNYTDDWTGRLNGRFEIGVTIFFVLSAFLLTGRWFASPNDGRASPPSLRKYFISRAKRVLPAYWIVVTAAFLIHASDNPPPAAGE